MPPLRRRLRKALAVLGVIAHWGVNDETERCVPAVEIDCGATGVAEEIIENVVEGSGLTSGARDAAPRGRCVRSTPTRFRQVL
jgi:hypothetical protein